MKRLLVGFVILLFGAGVAAWLSWPSLTRWARQRIETLVSTAVDRPTRIQELSISIIPLTVRVRGVVIGTQPPVLAEAGMVEVRLWVLASLMDLRPVLSARLESVNVDLQQLPRPAPRPERSEHHAARLLPVRVAEVRLTQARLAFQLDRAETVLTVAEAVGRLDSHPRTQLLTASAEAAGVQLERAGQQLKLQEIQVAGGLDHRRIFLRRASASGDAINLSLKPAAVPREYALAATIGLDQVAAFFGEPVKGQVRIAGNVSGDVANPDVKGEITVTDLEMHGRAVGNVKAEVLRDVSTLRVTAADIDGPVGELTGTATLTTSGTMPIEGDVNVENVDLDALLHALGQHEEIGNQVAGVASVSGTLNPLELTVKTTGVVRRGTPSADQRMPPEGGDESPPNSTITSATPAAAQAGGSAGLPAPSTAGQVIGAFDLNAHVTKAETAVQLEVQQPEQKNRISADLSMKDEQLSGPLQLQVNDLAALAQLAPRSVRSLGLSGHVAGTVTLSGSAARPKIEASVTGTDMSAVGVSVPQLVGDVVIEDSILNVRSVKIVTATGGAELSGALALGSTVENDWRLEIRNFDTNLVVGTLQTLMHSTPAIGGGHIDGRIVARGPWPRVALDATVSVSALYLGRELIERIDVAVNSAWPRWSLRTNVTHSAGETLSIEGSGSAMSELQVAINSTPFQLSNLRTLGHRNVRGAVSIRGNITGNLREPEGTLDVVASEVSLEGRRLGDMAVHARGAPNQWTVTAAAFEGALDLNAEVRSTVGSPYALTLRLRGWNFAQVISADPSLQSIINADVELHGFAMEPARPSGTIRIDQFEVSRGEYRVNAGEPIRIDVADGQFLIRTMRLAAPSSQLSVSGELTATGEMDVRAEGGGNMVLLELIGRPFSSARGEFTVAVHVQHHAPTGWQLNGRAGVRDTTLDLGLPVAFTDVNGDFTLAGSSVRIDTFDGKAGGGQFHVGGSVSLGQGPNLDWRVQDVAVSTSEGLEAEASGTGRVQGTWQVLDVSGDIEIVTALYDRNLELVDFLPFFREHVRPAPQTKPPAVQVRLHLHFHAPGGLYVDNNVAKVEMSADLRIEGTVDKPQVSGTIEFLTGEVKFRQRTFNVTGGSVDFRGRDQINPVLSISAESQISTVEADYTITVTVTGTADKPRVELSADDPTLTETDILSLITFGATTAQLQRQGGGISAVDALALLPTGTATAPVAKLLGVNRLEIEAVQGPAATSAGSIQPRVTVGKDLTDRLRASVSSTFGGVATERTAQLEYRVTRRISLLGSWEGQTTEQSGAFGGDVKFRYEFRKLPFSLLPGGFETTADPHAQ